MKDAEQLRLPDGRTLEYVLTGPADGRVLLFHHGTPGSAHQPQFVADAAHRRGWQLLTMSRAGCAGSSRAPGRTVADVTPDVRALLDQLGLARVLVGGASGGGPHALACGALLPDRVEAVLAVCCVAPYGLPGLDFLAGMGEENVTEFGLALDGEPALRKYLEQELPPLRAATAEQIVEAMATVLPPVDRAVLTGELGKAFAAAMRSAASGTVNGWLDDDLAFTRPWGFDLEQLRVPVSLWQGSEDLMVPFAHGQWLAERIPGVRAHLEQGEGHLSISVGAIEQMLEELESLAG